MRSETKRAALIALATILAFVVSGRPLQAQIAMVSEQDLSFGLVTPGVITSVAPTDVTRRARLALNASAGNNNYRLTFALPTELISGANTISISFAATDGRLEIRNTVTTFDPNAGVTFKLKSADGTAYVFLGGLVSPTTGAMPGTYTATITATIVQL